MTSPNIENELFLTCHDLIFQTIYDAYGNGQVVNTPPTSNPSTTASINGIYNTTTRYHRSQSQDPTYKALHTVQPPKSLNSSIGSGGVAVGKPVPPPKPKSYPNPPQSSRANHFATTSFVESNYMNSLTNNQTYTNGNGMPNRSNGNGSNGLAVVNGNGCKLPINDDDSGQGSSLDRDYAIYNNTTPDHHRYANPPGSMYSAMDHSVVNGNGNNGSGNGYNGSGNGVSPAVRRQQQQQQQYSNGLDLTNNREYRGSAFELYKKPLSSHNHTNGSSPGGHYQNSVW